jgi:hypothetical protein
VLPIAEAAVQAVRTAGTEVAATRVAGNERGPRGRWAQLRHRRRHPKADVDKVAEALPETGTVVEPLPAG